MESSDALLKERESMRRDLEGIAARGKGGLSTEDQKKLLWSLFFIKWSEIRKDAARVLQQYEGLYADAAKALFIVILDEIGGEEDVPWQKLHGALLGFNALLGKAISDDIDRDIYLRTKDVCLRLQGNPQMPVREQVHKCLVHLFERSEESERQNLFDGLLHNAIKLIKERQQAAETLGYIKTPSPSSSKSPTKGFNFESSAISSPRTNRSIERTAYVLEGTLGFIHSVFEYTPDLFQLLTKTLHGNIKTHTHTGALGSVFTALDLSSAASPDVGTDSATVTMTTPAAVYAQASFYVAISGCLGDISSTVRQAAAQALVALLGRSDKEAKSGEGNNNGDAAYAISKTVYEDLTERLQAASSLDVSKRGIIGTGAEGASIEGQGQGQGQSWLELEACLLLSEGLIKNSLELTLDALQSCAVVGSSDSATDGSMNDAAEKEGSGYFYRYLQALVGALDTCVLNPAFEIRRAATQVVPLLARLLSLRFPRLLFLREGEVEEGGDSSTDNGEEHLDRDSSAPIYSMLRTIYSFYWLSEVTKASQHMREVVAGAPSSPSASASTGPPSAQAPGHGSPEAHAMWALEVSGRLGEEENKTHFRQRLRALVSCEGGPSALAALRVCLAVITGELERILPRLHSLWASNLNAFKQVEEKGEGWSVIALDVAEASALAACAVYGTSPPTPTVHEEDPHASAVNGNAPLGLLQAWTQSKRLIPHLLRTTGGRHRERGGGGWSAPETEPGPALSPSSSSLRHVLIIPSVADPCIDPAILLIPRLPSLGGSGAGLILSSPRHIHTGMQGSAIPPPGMSPRSVHSTNRQFCESVAPVLPMLSLLHARCHGGSEQLQHVLSLSQLCAHWLSCCLSDAQFLERRQHLRNGLCAALGTFLMKTLSLCQSQTQDGPVTEAKDDLSGAAQQLIDLECLVVRATHLAVEQMAARGSVSAHEALTCGTLAKSARLVASSYDLLNVAFATASSSSSNSNSSGSSSTSKGNHSDKHTLHPHFAQLITDLNRVKAMLRPATSRSSALLTGGGAAATGNYKEGEHEEDTGDDVEEDEFSDWDESSEELNISVNSISAIKEEEESDHCLQEIDRTLQYLGKQ